jgi:hypothetical protein
MNCQDEDAVRMPDRIGQSRSAYTSRRQLGISARGPNRNLIDKELLRNVLLERKCDSTLRVSDEDLANVSCGEC